MLIHHPQFAAAHPAELRASFEAIEHSDDHLTHVPADGTPQGYFQRAALSIVDDQYPPDWHGLYNDTTIMTDERQAVQLITETERTHTIDTEAALSELAEQAMCRIPGI